MIAGGDMDERSYYSTASSAVPSGESTSKKIRPSITAPLLSSKNSEPSPRPPSGPGSGKSIDVHPFSRGSVIEVVHISQSASDDDWLDDSTPENSVVYLCEVIDRASDGEGKWRYYVHYRELNRRMDEWIGVERIVSPPSVGNAKARALKRKKDDRGRGRRDKEDRQRKRIWVTGRKRREDDDITTSGDDELEIDEERRRSSNRKRMRLTASTDNAEFMDMPQEGETRLTRRQRRKTNDAAFKCDIPSAGEEHAVDVVTTLAAPVLDEHEGMDEAALKEHEEVTKVKNVATLELGQYQMDTWYFSPLPKELLPGGMIDVLYVDEFSLSFFTRKVELTRFQARELKKGRRHPPGNEIYRCGNLSMFEVDGFEERIYCQNLCYIAKLFLDHKTLYFDVDPFLFYVLCEFDERGYHPVGYYSKEKYSDVGYNLACILTFPAHQRKGYGRFLIAFSYELSKKEEKVGSPEKPMSDLGQQAYIPYWTSTIVEFLLNQSGECKSMSIMDISKQTSILAEDIIFALNTLGILKFVNGVYFISAERHVLEELAKMHPIKKPRVDPSKLHWTPYLTDVKRDKFSICNKKASVDADTGAVQL